MKPYDDWQRHRHQVALEKRGFSMPVQPTYPGVYIEELPGGVRTITGGEHLSNCIRGSSETGSCQ
jgi:hypothetical protein